MRATISMTAGLLALSIAIGTAGCQHSPLPAAPSPARGGAASTNWEHYGNTLDGQRFLDADEITPQTVGQLKPAWIFHTNVVSKHTSFESQPLIVNGTLYVTSPTDHVFALDAGTGMLKWTYNPTDLVPLAKLDICCGVTNRGAAYGDGRIYIARLDDKLVALDARTGKPVWTTQIADWKEHYTETMAPQFADGKVIVGISGAELMTRGRVTAYDARTGHELWHFHTIPGPGEPGHETWAGDSWKTGGGSVWQTPNVDAQLGLVYVNTGNAAPDEDGSNREGLNLYTSSVVALDLATGKPRWHFQEVHHDMWDYDAIQPTQLFSVRKDGHEIPAIGHGNKDGNYFILDRRTGKPIYGVTEEPAPTEPVWQHPWPTQPAGLKLEPTTVDPKSAMAGISVAPQFTPPGEQPTMQQPGFETGPEWVPGAYSPRTRYAYLPVGGYEPWVYESHRGRVNTLGSTGTSTNVKGVTYGLVSAVDVDHNRIAWTDTTDYKAMSGLVVAGDLVFFGRAGGEFVAADAKTGEIRWHWAADSTMKGVGAPDGAPAAYVVNGREYIVQAFGGNFRERVDVAGKHKAGQPGDALIAFAIPQGHPAPPRVAFAHPAPVPEGKGTAVAPLQHAPAGADVVEIDVHDYAFFPDRFQVKPGAQVAIHLVNHGFKPVGMAVKLPAGALAMKGPVKPQQDAYFLFTAPAKEGVYEFMSPLGPQVDMGLQGTFLVTSEGPAGLVVGKGGAYPR